MAARMGRDTVGTGSAEHAHSPGLDSRHCVTLGMVAHACNPSIQEVEA